MRCAIGLLALLCSAAYATNLDDLTLGEAWWGEPYKVSELKGHVTLVDFWGKN